MGHVICIKAESDLLFSAKKKLNDFHDILTEMIQIDCWWRNGYEAGPAQLFK